MSIIETINKISNAVDLLLDFIANNEILSNDFENFLKINKIEIKTQQELNKIILLYIFENSMQDGVKVLDFYINQNKNVNIELLNSFKDSYHSIFQIEKIHKNSFSTHCLTNEMELELIPLVKTITLRSIGVKDYISGRIIKYMGQYYLLEIDDVISSSDNKFAQAQGVKILVKNPEKIHWQNNDKLEEFSEIVSVMTKSFAKGIGAPSVITTNKLADDLLEYFNKYHHNLLKEETLEPLIKTPEKWNYFDIEEYKEIQAINDEYLENAAGGFSNHKCLYDVGFWVDNELGIFIIPFLGTFFEIINAKNDEQRGQISNWQQCIIDFWNSSKVPPSVLLHGGEKLVTITNTILESNYKTVDDIIKKFKSEYLDTTKFSPTIVLYNSNVFYELLECLQEKPQPEREQTVGRNDPCPCGSGKKYKKCCLK